MEDRNFGIDGLDLLAHLRRDGPGIELSAKIDRQILGGMLVHGAVKLRDDRVGQRFRAGIRNYTNDRGPNGIVLQQLAVAEISSAQTNAFAHRVFVGPEGASGGLIDDRDVRRALDVLIVEEASTQ